MNYLTLLKTILTLMPLIIEAIKAVEAAIPGRGKGEAKLAMIRGILEGAYKVADDATMDFEKLWPALNAAITAVVSAFKTTGVFEK